MEPTPRAAEEAGPAAERRESIPGVLGIGFGLLLLALCILALLRPMGGAIDAEALAAEWFPGGLPAGFTVAEAVLLPTAERTLRLERAELEEERTASAGPSELVLVRYRSNAGAEAAMRGGSKPSGEGRPGRPGGPGHDPFAELARWEQERDFATHLTVERGELAWGAWRAPRATERSLRADGTWREAVRVNLSQPDRYRVLFALWPVGVEAEPDALRSLLRGVEMKALDGADAVDDA